MQGSLPSLYLSRDPAGRRHVLRPGVPEKLRRRPAHAHPEGDLQRHLRLGQEDIRRPRQACGHLPRKGALRAGVHEAEPPGIARIRTAGIAERPGEHEYNLVKDARQEGLKRGIRATVLTLKEFTTDKAAVAQKLVKQFELLPQTAEEKVAQYWES